MDGQQGVVPGVDLRVRGNGTWTCAAFGERRSRWYLSFLGVVQRRNHRASREAAPRKSLTRLITPVRGSS